MASARDAALLALDRVFENDGYSNIVIDREIRRAGLDRRDAAFASAIFYGVLEKRMLLDYYIKKFLSRPKPLPEEHVMNLLRVAVYQMLFLDRVPDAAAVNEAVAAASSYCGGKYKGFVNGVLRAFQRGREEVPEPWQETVRYSLPQEVISLWKHDYGKAVTASLLPAISMRAPVFLRVNTLKTDVASLLWQLPENARAVEELPGAIRVDDAGDLTALPPFSEGLFHVQDLSSQLLCALMAPEPGETVADVCAAPGGKSFTMAERMENTGRIDAFDLHENRVRLIRDGAERLRVRCISAVVRDAETGGGEPIYDRVLCDVPCSGLGAIRRKPEIRYRAARRSDALPKLQYAILENSAKLVKPGGLLVYSTCTLCDAENGAVARRFQKEHPEFAPHPLVLTGWTRVLKEPVNMLTMMPQMHGGDGFFAAAFRREAL